MKHLSTGQVAVLQLGSRMIHTIHYRWKLCYFRRCLLHANGYRTLCRIINWIFRCKYPFLTMGSIFWHFIWILPCKCSFYRISFFIFKHNILKFQNGKGLSVCKWCVLHRNRISNFNVYRNFINQYDIYNHSFIRIIGCRYVYRNSPGITNIATLGNECQEMLVRNNRFLLITDTPSVFYIVICNRSAILWQQRIQINPQLLTCINTCQFYIL